AVASGCASADGSFSIDTSSVTTEVDQIIYYDGTTKEIADLACTANPCELSQVTTTFDPEIDPTEIAKASLESFNTAIRTCMIDEWGLDPKKSISSLSMVKESSQECDCAEGGQILIVGGDSPTITIDECITTSNLSFSGTAPFTGGDDDWAGLNPTLEPSGECTSASGEAVNMLPTFDDCSGTMNMICGEDSTEVTCTLSDPAEGSDDCTVSCE
ncbi:MAG: hypothetical protein HN337_09230, partial [Deltaproteobacteria bacterium]|nr:hypothetical protein [Deltaproteobacteria bacterium]